MDISVSVAPVFQPGVSVGVGVYLGAPVYQPGAFAGVHPNAVTGPTVHRYRYPHRPYAGKASFNGHSIVA